MALFVEPADLEKVVPHAHLVVFAASASIYLATEEGHPHGHASVTPEEVALGIGEQVSGVGTAYTTSGFVVISFVACTASASLHLDHSSPCT